MELVNSSPLPAQLDVTIAGDDRDVRRGLLVAKATFEVEKGGATRLVLEDPFPIATEDEETELGVLPCDISVRDGDELEVSLLGKAHAWNGRPVSSMTVEMTIGALRWALLVTGDRFWVGDGASATISESALFSTMPLTWERAYGGTKDVQLDPHTLIEIPDARNPIGRGFDPTSMARGLAAALGVPEGYPRWETLRPLPNIEHPAVAIRKFADAPLPICWVPRPLGLTRPRHLDRILAGDASLELDPRPFRCIDALVLNAVPRDQSVCVRGVTPSGEWSFTFPNLRVNADYCIGSRRGTREMMATRLVLLPEQSRFFIVYQKTFFARIGEDDERSFRLRLAGGDERG